jgi:hypothetical protein
MTTPKPTRIAHTRDSLIDALQRYAAGTTKPVTFSGFCRQACVPGSAIRRFGGFAALVAAANLAHRRAKNATAATNDKLLADLHRVAGIVGHMPAGADLNRFGSYCNGTYFLRFGRAATIRAAYLKWCRTRRAKPLPPAPKGGAAGMHERLAFRPGSAPPLGEPLGFRGLQYAPSTEAGVIYLLGLLGPETGLAVENIGSAFPDCRAARRLRDGTWRPVAVEFELRSSNFKAHGHDPKNCDLIVCWEHDWPACPLEVLELKTLVAKAIEQGRSAWHAPGSPQTTPSRAA